MPTQQSLAKGEGGSVQALPAGRKQDGAEPEQEQGRHLGEFGGRAPWLSFPAGLLLRHASVTGPHVGGEQ